MGRLNVLRVCFGLVLFFSVFSCHKSAETGTEYAEMFSPVLVSRENTTIYMYDYFPDPTVVDSIIVTGGYDTLFVTNNELVLIAPKVTPSLAYLTFYVKQEKYVVVIKGIVSEEHKMMYPSSGAENQVYVAGGFNAWSTTKNPLTLTDGKWKTDLRLPFGTYQYKFVVDGQWISDPANSDSVENNLGGYNSVLQVGVAVGKEPVLQTRLFEKRAIYFTSTNIDNIVALWQNKMLHVTSTEEGEVITIPEEAGNMPRSHIRIFGANKDRFSNDILIPLKNGEVIENTKFLDRTDKHTLQLYNVFVDRFFDGDSANNRTLDSPDVHPRADYHGGDLAGIIKKIKQGYFQDLGINTLWISPIVQNPDSAYGFYPDPPTKFSAYHGYWPVSYTKIDERFGNDSIFSVLVQKAHDEDLNILVDFVANHVHELHPIYQQHPEWATDLYLPDGSLNTERWDDHRLTTWFDTFLPTLDHTIPEVTKIISDSALYWYQTFGIDGFRHDATKHVPEIFWRTLTRKIKQAKGPGEMFYQVGETYGAPELIGSYVNSGQMDGQFDFNVYDALVNVFAGDDPDFHHLGDVINESLQYYGSHHVMGNISGNQDRARFVSYADGSISFNEDAKHAGWTRNIMVRDTLAYFKMAMLMAVNFTIPGVPVIYYGDEIGMPGGNDPDNRRMMDFSERNLLEEGLYAKVKKMSNLRRNSMALMYGDFQVTELTPGTLVYQRVYFDETMIVAFNNRPVKTHLSVKIPSSNAHGKIKNHFDQKVVKSGDQLKVELNPYAFEIILIK